MYCTLYNFTLCFFSVMKALALITSHSLYIRAMSYSYIPLCGVKLRGVMHTVESVTCQVSVWSEMLRLLFLCESSSSVCITPRSQAPRCASYRGVKFSDMHHTTESNCTPQSKNQILWESLVAFKGAIRRNPFRVEHIYHESKDLKKQILIC